MNKGEKRIGWREFIFWIIAILIIPLVALVMLETGLRVAGVGYSTDFTRKIEHDGKIYIAENDQFSRLFFPPKLAQSPQSFAFSAVKPDKTFRIFILGGSAAEGDPDASYGFGPILETLLENQYQGVNFEIINAAITATNSHVVLDVAKDLVQYQPDLFVIYVGNNEVIGPFGAGTVFAPFSSNLSMIRAGVALRSTRLGQLLQDLVAFLPKGDEKKEWGGMSMFLDHQVRYDDPALANVHNHFRENLKDILDITRKSGATTIISTVGSNIKNCAPFASLHKKNLTDEEKNYWDSLFQAGKNYQLQNNFSAALTQYLQASETDAEYADLQFLMGQCYWNLEEFQKAKEKFIMARELDTLRFRADNQINDIIRSVANERADENIFLADGARALAGNSPQQIPGEELFYEHVHLRFAGNYILAKQLFGQVTNNLPDDIKQSADSRSFLTEEECALRLAVTGYDQHRILTFLLNGRYSAPPFTNQLDHDANLEKVKLQIAELERNSYADVMKMVEIYRQALSIQSERPALHRNFANLLFKLGNFREAFEQIKLFMQAIPHDYGAHGLAADALLRLGEYAEAATQSQTALELNPSYHYAAFTLAKAFAQLGKLDESLRTYEDLLHDNPAASVDVYNEMGMIFINQKALDKAAEAFRNAIQANAVRHGGDIPDVYFNLAFVQKQLGRKNAAVPNFDRAIESYRRQLERSPDDPGILIAMGSALFETGRFSQAALTYAKAVAAQPLNLSYRLDLIKSLEAQGEHTRASRAIDQAISVFTAAGRETEVGQIRKYREYLQKQGTDR
jgi:tetratricopeptide (TPR) repeat protein